MMYDDIEYFLNYFTEDIEESDDDIEFSDDINVYPITIG